MGSPEANTGALRSSLLAAGLAGSLLLAACGGGGDSEPAERKDDTVTREADDTSSTSEADQTSPETFVPEDFMAVCGTQLCLDGEPFRIHSATTYGQLDNAEEEIALAIEAGLNTLEIVEYENQYRELSDTMSEETWTRIDNFIALAKENNLHIILNLSSYGHALREAGQKPTTTDWAPFLDFVSNRVNTVTGTPYKEEPAIIMVQLLGEIDAPNYDEPTRGTMEETTEFYQRTLAQAQERFPNHIITSGGLSYLDDPNSGIDWRTIMADDNNEVCAVEVNSFGDRNISVPNVSRHCEELDKPWFLAAWSSCFRQTGPEFDGDANSWPTDSAMAAHAADMYRIARTAAGTSFWNLGTEGECDISPAFPETFRTIQSNAP